MTADNPKAHPEAISGRARIAQRDLGNSKNSNAAKRANAGVEEGAIWLGGRRRVLINGKQTPPLVPYDKNPRPPSYHSPHSRTSYRHSNTQPQWQETACKSSEQPATTGRSLDTTAPETETLKWTTLTTEGTKASCRPFSTKYVHCFQRYL